MPVVFSLKIPTRHLRRCIKCLKVSVYVQQRFQISTGQSYISYIPWLASKLVIKLCSCVHVLSSDWRCRCECKCEKQPSIHQSAQWSSNNHITMRVYVNVCVWRPVWLKTHHCSMRTGAVRAWANTSTRSIKAKVHTAATWVWFPWFFCCMSNHLFLLNFLPSCHYTIKQKSKITFYLNNVKSYILTKQRFYGNLYKIK